eukprot:521031_1
MYRGGYIHFVSELWITTIKIRKSKTVITDDDIRHNYVDVDGTIAIGKIKRTNRILTMHVWQQNQHRIHQTCIDKDTIKTHPKKKKHSFGTSPHRHNKSRSIEH